MCAWVDQGWLSNARWVNLRREEINIFLFSSKGDNLPHLIFQQKLSCSLLNRSFCHSVIHSKHIKSVLHIVEPAHISDYLTSHDESGRITASSRINAQFRIARIPLLGSKVIFQSVVTQCESCLGINPTPTSILVWLETLWALMRKDTIFTIRSVGAESLLIFLWTVYVFTHVCY